MKKKILITLCISALVLLSLIACGREMPKYMVMFESDCDQIVDPQMVEVNGKVVEPVLKARPGYTFLGWYESSSSSSKWDFNNKKVTKSVVLTARWGKDANVKFDTGVEEETVPSIVVTYNSLLEEPKLETVREGYTFAGWYNGSVKWNFKTSKVTKDITLTAKWEADKTIKFETANGETIPERVVAWGEKLEEPKLENGRDGYVFLGWYNGTALWDFEKNTVSKDMTLTAKWGSYLEFVPIIKDGVETGEMQVTSCKDKVGNIKVENVVIPSTHQNKPVTALHFTFADKKEIKTIVLPDTITSISAGTFAGCTNLETIIIPSSVVTIEAGAFENCEKLTFIYCEAEEMPQTWATDFNKTEAEVVFGYEEAAE